MKKIPLLLWVVSIVLLSGCSSQNDQISKPVMVKTASVMSHGSEFEIIYPGKTLSSSDVNVSFRISGPIASIPVKEGQFVRKGQTIANMDKRDYKIQLDATEAEYNKIKGEADRVIELYKRGSATANDYDKAVYGLQQITQKLESHRNSLNDTDLKAPFDGYIQKKHYSQGETVGSGMPVISMIGSNGMEIEINIPTSDYMRRDKFSTFSFSSDNIGKEQHQVELVGITRKANLNQLYSARFRVSQDIARELTAGMSVNVKIGYNRGESSLVTIPLSAMFEKDGESAVWIFDQATSQISLRIIKPVQILRDDRVVIDSNLKAGETIVTAGVHKLQDGMKVSVLPAPSKSNVGGLL